ncbi:MAG TPA: hypothetical protein VK631_01250, partial [Solirubrobacteraceae bacterium]|nr:hypothetical protein [Solirubrobacteraceae bacterium]
CPPVGPRSDAVLLAAAADAVVLVVDVKQSDEEALTVAVRRLRSARARLIGVVLNRDKSGAEYLYDRHDRDPGSPLGRARDRRASRRRPRAAAGA